MPGLKGFDAGRIILRLTLDNESVRSVEVSCKRPNIAGALSGQLAVQAVELIPLIYSICGTAQRVAANAALAAARGIVAPPRRNPEVAAEAIREHAYKLLIEWPRHFGLATDEALFVQIAKLKPGQHDKAIAAEIHACAVLEPLKELAEADEPGRTLSERMMARAEALTAMLVGKDTEYGMLEAAPSGDGCGRAIVGTARGKLVHELTIEDDRIRTYEIVAPTDRIFSLEGPLPGMLIGVEASQARRMAELAVLMLDPCVPCELQVNVK